VAVELPKIERMADMVTATAALVDAAACGVMTPAEAAELGKLIGVHARAIETPNLREPTNFALSEHCQVAWQPRDVNCRLVAADAKGADLHAQ
jgi:hypothetical protein